MNKTPFATTIALFLIVTVVGSTAMLAAPRQARAQSSVVGAINCVKSLLGGAAGSVVNKLTAVPVSNTVIELQTTTTAGATLGNCIYDTVLVPLARLLARMVLQQITSSTITWINGGNGSGQALYVRNFPAHLQSVGDMQASVFLGQFSKLNSPFGVSIASALKVNYLQQTSGAGFFAANKSTLAQASPNVQTFLNGGWTQGGGARAWFALTTQSQNNPYMLYVNSGNQIASLAATAQAASTKQLDWGQGFFAWCGPGTTSNAPLALGGAVPTCMKPDGSTASALTPGSVLHDYTQQAVVNSGISQLVAANDLDSALGAIISALGKKIIGATGGLFGASQPSGGAAATITSQLQNYSGTSGSGSATSDNLSNRISQYQGALGVASVTANQAQIDVVSLTSACPANSSISGFTTQVQTAFVLVAQGQSLLANANAVLVQTKANPSATGDVATLADVPPTSEDIATMQQISAQMTAVSVGAQSAKNVCAPQAP